MIRVCIDFFIEQLFQILLFVLIIKTNNDICINEKSDSDIIFNHLFNHMHQHQLYRVEFSCLATKSRIADIWYFTIQEFITPIKSFLHLCRTCGFGPFFQEFYLWISPSLAD